MKKRYFYKRANGTLGGLLAWSIQFSADRQVISLFDVGDNLIGAVALAPGEFLVQEGIGFDAMEAIAMEAPIKEVA